jgi:hypothetical protein
MPADLRRSVEAWRAQRHAALRRPMSWLTLVGLDFLAEGRNRIGSDPGNEVMLPGGPPLAGVIELRDGVATASSVDGGFLVDGVPVDGVELVSDHDETEERPATTLEIGSLRVRLIRRGAARERFGLRTWDVEAPVRDAFTGVPHWPIDPAWVVEARFEPAEPGATLTVPDVLGDLLEETTPGAVIFGVAGTPCRIDAVEGGDAGELWLIFGDATNGTETYGGGRFLYTSAPRPDGLVTVDFNRAYNPPCVFSPYATCPLPPAGNRLDVRVEAGELLFTPPAGA